MAQVIICGGIALIPYIRPVGAFQIANVLRDHGYTVQVIDQFPWIAHLGKEKTIEVLKHFVGPETLWIGFSSNWLRKIGPNGTVSLTQWSQEERVAEMLMFTPQDWQDIKQSLCENSPNLKFVVGGAKSNLARSGWFQNVFDYSVEGYGDIKSIELTRWLETGENPPEMVVNQDGSETLHLNPKADGFDFKNHKFTWQPEDLVNKGEALPIEISRGCIFSCAFCAYPLNGRKNLFDYLKDPAILRAQFIENYEKFETTRYFFLDDTFNDNVEKLEVIHREVFSKLPFKIEFGSFMRLDLLHAHPHTIDLLADMGVSGAQFGIESLNEEANKTIGKRLKRENARWTLERCRESWGDRAVLDSQFILGLPNETEETIKDWMDELMEDDYPLDFVKADPLTMTLSSRSSKVWQSKFEQFPEHYGYSFPDPIKRPDYWVNNQGLDFYQCNEIKKSYANQFDVLKKSTRLTWVIEHGTKNIGVNTEMIEAKKQGKMSSITGIDYIKRRRFVDRYIKNLLAL